MYRYKVLLLKHWWVPTLGLLLGLGGGWTVACFDPPSFISVGRMIVNIRLAIPEGSVYSEEMSSFLGTQSALMQSGAVLGRAQARASAQHPDGDAGEVVVRVSVVPKTTVFVLQATGREPRYTEAFLQACMEEYIQFKREMRAETSDTTVAGLTEEILRLEKELRKADDELAAFLNTNSVVLLQEQGNSVGTYVTSLNQRLAALRSEHALLAALSLDQNLEHDQQNAGFAIGPVSQTGEAESDYLKAKQRILLLKSEQVELGQYLRPKHPKMIALSDEIARRERVLEIFRQQSAEQLEARKTSLLVQIENLERDMKESETRALEISRRSGEYQKIKANTQRVQGLYERLLGTMQTLDLNKEISPETVTIMEKASPAFPAQPKLEKHLLIGALLGFGAALGVLMLINRLDDRMSCLTELRELFDEEVLGQVPREKTVALDQRASLIKPEDRRHGLVEAYRNLRSSLLYFAEHNNHPRTLLLTSSVPNEGKSMTSANLAITLAAAGSNVLLVDADLRKGTLHSLFGIQDQPGLHEALAGRSKWRELVHSTLMPNLSFMPRGNPTPLGGELFLKPLTQTFLRECGEGYDWVLIDTAPVMAADDVTSLAPLVDGVLFVIRAEQTSARVARAALDLLYQRQVPVLGVIFNSVRPNSSDYHCYKYQDYYRAYPAAT